jgi:hypothetical protein
MARQKGRDRAATSCSSKGKKTVSSNAKKTPRLRSSEDEKRFLERHERQSFEEYSMNSSSTDSTRPTVHTKRAVAAASPSQSRSREDLSEAYTSSYDNNHRSPQSGDHPPSGRNSKNRSKGRAHSNNPVRQRVPGGAAAKLMFRGPQKSADSSEVVSSHTMESHDDAPVDTSDIYDMINRAKVEFETGRRTSPLTIGCGDEEIEVSYPGSKREDMAYNDDDTEQRTPSVTPIPHILNREEAYHESASAAVAAILNPQKSDNASVSSNMSEMYSTHSGSRIYSSHSKHNNASVSAFQSPKFNDCGSVGSQASNNEEMFDSRQGAGHLRSPTTEPLISDATEAKLDRMSQKMLDPSKTLSDLLRAIASPEDMPTKDRAYMVRRKNACGALKVLTAHNRRRKQICWTVGVLPALTSVLQDAGEDRLENVYPDIRTRMEYEEARRRAIAALTNLAMPVSNRLAVFHTPGLVQALISTVMRVDGESLEGACAILAYLAKSNENKILMAQVPGLFDAVLRVLRPKMKEAQPMHPDSPKEDYPWTSSMSDSGSSMSSGDDDDEEEDNEDDHGELEEDASILSGSTNTASSDGDSSGDDEDDEDMDGDTSDEDMSTDRESLSGSDGSDSLGSGTSGDESGSEYRLPTTKKKGAKGQQKKGGTSSKPSSPRVDAYRAKLNSDYDKDKLITAARKNLFAMLGHLVKEKDNAVRENIIRAFDHFDSILSTNHSFSCLSSFTISIAWRESTISFQSWWKSRKCTILPYTFSPCSCWPT